MLPDYLMKYGKVLILGGKNKASVLVRLGNCDTLACLSSIPEYVCLSRIRELSRHKSSEIVYKYGMNSNE